MFCTLSRQVEPVAVGLLALFLRSCSLLLVTIALTAVLFSGLHLSRDMWPLVQRCTAMTRMLLLLYPTGFSLRVVSSKRQVL